MFLVVGLGNIGDEYDGTRHNLGFLVVDHLARHRDVSFEKGKLGLVAEYILKDLSDTVIILLKPTTGMNLSGLAVAHWMSVYDIPRSNVLIVSDDLNMPFGKFRLRRKGSAGGHNGLRHIQQMLSSTEYARLGFGIGKSADVLDKFIPREGHIVKDSLESICELIRSFILETSP